MPFSPQTLDFLFENRLNDSKIWFNEHKDEYNRYVSEPFEEFMSAVMSRMGEIDELISYTRMSRIYRDARFAKGKSVFRENMWCIFGRGRELYKSLPAFYFDISPNGFEYGCGYYMASADSMAAIRELILSDSPYFTAAADAYASQNVFELYGDIYKRSRFPLESEEKRFWLDRKTIGLSAGSTDWQLLFSDKLADKIVDDLISVVPVYNLFMAAEAGCH